MSLSNLETVMAEIGALKELVLGLKEEQEKKPAVKKRHQLPEVARKDIVDLNNMISNSQLFGREGGLFTDCDIQAPIMNTTIQPTNTLANVIPVVPTMEQYVRFQYITQLTDGSAGPQNGKCDIPPDVGDLSVCSARYNVGRLSFGSNTMELDALIQKAHRGVHEDLYVVGDLRGVSVTPTREQLQSREFIQASAIRRQMHLIGRRFDRTLSQRLWDGNPTDPAQNGAGGGWAAFWGLTYQVADDYGDPLAKPYVSGTNCAQLNSDVKDFASACIGGSTSIYEYMREMEDTLYNRATLMGLDPVQWVWVMQPTVWSELIKILPCEMLAEGCASGNVNLNDGGSGMFNLAMREQLRRSQTLDTNGRSHRVILDHAIPYTSGTANNRPYYESSIFLLPLVVAGERVLEWRYMDYTQFESVLAPVGGQERMDGWTDGGRVHWIIDRVRRCFQLDAKIEPGLVLRAPHLAGRIDNVRACPLQAKPMPFAAV